jgi:hypothetical protein
MRRGNAYLPEAECVPVNFHAILHSAKNDILILFYND